MPDEQQRHAKEQEHGGSQGTDCHRSSIGRNWFEFYRLREQRTASAKPVHFLTPLGSHVINQRFFRRPELPGASTPVQCFQPTSRSPSLSLLRPDSRSSRSS